MVFNFPSKMWVRVRFVKGGSQNVLIAENKVHNVSVDAIAVGRLEHPERRVAELARSL